MNKKALPCKNSFKCKNLINIDVSKTKAMRIENLVIFLFKYFKDCFKQFLTPRNTHKYLIS